MLGLADYIQNVLEYLDLPWRKEAAPPEPSEWSIEHLEREWTEARQTESGNRILWRPVAETAAIAAAAVAVVKVEKRMEWRRETIRSRCQKST